MTAKRLWIYALVLAGLLVAGESVLIGRALAAIGREERLEHERVAARVVSELDRRLDEIVAGEEERPFTQYRYFCVPAGAVSGSLALQVSPIAKTPTNPWLVGHYQIDPDGSFHTPLQPRNEELARLATQWSDIPATSAVVAELKRVTHGQQRVLDGDEAVAMAGPWQEATPVGQSLASVDVNLNKLGNRSGKTNAVQAPARSVYNFQNDKDNALQQSYVAGNGGQGQAMDVQAVNCAVQQEVLSALNISDESMLEVSQGPMRRLSYSDGVLVLGREVLVAGQRYRQGFAVRLVALGQVIAADVIREAELGDVLRMSFTTDDEGTAEERYRLVHRCTVPFGDLQATVGLRALPGAVPGARRTVWWLGGALLAATVVGVWALASMLATALAFSQRRQDFVAAVSHELKTPLTAIRLHAEMLRDGLAPDQAKQHQYHATIVAESERLTRLIGNVLELAHLERDDRPVQLEVGDPLTVVRDVVRIVEPHAISHGFTLSVTGDAAAAAARFDRDALLQVVMNVVDNAIKFSRTATERRIELQYNAGPDGPTITIRDHGPGVPVADLRKIFEPFWRGERELTRTTTGTGIGLSLVHGLVRRMGGRVSARNHPQGGFEISIALAAA